MIPSKIQSLFDFIDYLDNNKEMYIEKYVPLCNELKLLDNQRGKLNPSNNYKDKLKYDKIQTQINEKFSPITINVYNPITNKLRELEIWSGDDTYNSIWNSNSSAIYEFKCNFKPEDIPQVMEYKQKYLSFRKETDTDFLCLYFVFNYLDELLKEIFNFFKDTDKNEFFGFEAETIKVNNFEEVVNGFLENKGKNVKFIIPIDSVSKGNKNELTKSNSTTIKNEFVLGDKIKVGDIPNNNGQIIIGKIDTDKTSNTNSNNDLAKKSFNWQKWGIIIAAILGIIAIIVTILN
jgi:hypothetical protein